MNDYSKPIELNKKTSNKLPTETINKQIYKQNIKLLTKIISLVSQAKKKLVNIIIMYCILIT